MALARGAAYSGNQENFLPYWNRLASIAAYVLLGFLAWQIANLVWDILPGERHNANAPAQSAQSQNVVKNRQLAQVNLSAVAKLNLFGAAEKESNPAAARPNVTTAPETRLNLRLTGIYRAENENLSRAIISGGSSGREQPYGVGSEISRGVALHEIHDKHVVLERNGGYETLYLQKPDARSKNTAVQTTRPSRVSVPGKQLSSEVGRELKNIRDELLRDPQRAGQLIRIQPVSQPGSSEIKGYRVYPGKDRALFNRVGLRSGDLVTGVNGQSLNDPAKGFQILSELTNASQISLEINRRGRVENLSVDLNQ